MKKLNLTKCKIIFLLFFLLFFLFSPFFSKNIKASNTTLLQQIEIIRWEIQLLQSLILNFQSQQQITAQSYAAINLFDNSIILEKNSGQAYPIASITKLMTAVIAFENISINQKIILTEEMLRPWGHSPALFLGLNISAENLIKASLIQSTNDSAESLAYFTGKEKFIPFMNQKAKELGMTSTVFYDAHGLNPQNRSTVQDLTKLLNHIYKNHPQILTITKDNDFWLPNQTGRLLKFRNMNNFYHFSDFVGGKIGYLPEARQTFASIFNVNKEPVAVIILYSNNPQADIFSILKKIKVQQ